MEKDKETLKKLYLDEQLSQQKISELFGVQRQTINRWLKIYKISIRQQGDAVSLALTKNRKTSFSENLKEKAYLMGLRTGDLAVQKHGRSLRISVASSHPAMIKLFYNCFRSYGYVNKYPKFNKLLKKYLWAVYCDVDNSFEFLHQKPNKIPEWIVEDDSIFFNFLAGYFDAEGCIFLSYKHGNGSTTQWIIKSCDKNILEQISEKLKSLGFNLKLSIVKKADYKSYNKDYWCLQTGIKEQVMKIIALTPLKHGEKIQKYNLALKLIRSKWNGAPEKLSTLRNEIKDDVNEFTNLAKASIN